MNALLLYARHVDTLSYYDDWIDAFKNTSNLSLTASNVLCDAEEKNAIINTIKSSNLIILHHSMLGDSMEFIAPFLQALADRKGKLISFIGNEVNLPILGIAPRIKALQYIQPDIIATQLLQEAGEWLYADCTNTKVISIPHALNPHAFNHSANYHERTIDIGTRSHKYGAMIGDNDRNTIMDYIADLEGKLTIDIGQRPDMKQRFNREEWSQFLGSCKATTSTEAGSFYLERNDETINAIEEYLKNNSSKIVLPRENTLRRLYRTIIPKKIRSVLYNHLSSKMVEPHTLDQNANYDEIQKLFFDNKPKCPVYSKAISSRHFDAIGTNTLQILFPGRYNDIIKPGEHYFELKRDGSNIDALIELLNHPEQWKEIVTHTHNYIIKNHTHAHRVNALLEAL